MAEPFFSILLPTRNRSTILSDAIQSVLDQTFGDFELIVSDNDESPTATRDVVFRFNDPRLRYNRTSGNLPMHENWETVFDLARGKHVLLLEDKVRLVRNALEVLHANLQRLGDVVISYNLSFARTPTVPGPKEIPRAQAIPSAEVVESFCRFEQSFFTVLPKALDSCAPRALLQKVKASSPTGLLFSYISPDYASGFLLLSAVREIYRISETLVYIPNNWMWKGQFSNGQASYKITDSYKQFMASLPVRREQIIERVPIKTEFLWINSVIYDFFTFYRRPDHKADIDWVEYFGFCKVLLIIGKRLGAEMPVQRAAISNALRERGAVFRARVQTNLLRRCLSLGIQALKSRFGGER